jgi:precorrin-4/cobalt-precorrin-4 C11-methyltransferase
LLKHYSPDTPVAIGHRVSWPDEWLQVVPLDRMAAISREQNLIRTTLYVVSPALKAGRQRSKLYSPDHDHLFRPSH